VSTYHTSAVPAVGDHDGVSHDLTAHRVTTPEDLTSARHIHAQEYRRRGYVADSDLSDGVLSSASDPWQSQSQYFVARANRRTIGVARLIHADTALELPTMMLHDLDADVRAILERQVRGTIAEVSALVTLPGAPPDGLLALLSVMWRHSVAAGHVGWVFAIHPRVRTHIHDLLGPVTVRFGPDQWYLGSMVVPGSLWLETARDVLGRHAVSLPSDREKHLLSLFPVASSRAPE